MIAVCPNCRNRVEPDNGHCPLCHAEMSVPDAMIEQASVPNLATLFRTAKARGHITAGFQYGSGT